MPNRSVRFDAVLYPSVAIEETRISFIDRCDVQILDTLASEGCESTEVLIKPRPGAPENTVEEFLNAVLLAALERHFATTQLTDEHA